MLEVGGVTVVTDECKIFFERTADAERNYNTFSQQIPTKQFSLLSDYRNYWNITGNSIGTHPWLLDLQTLFLSVTDRLSPSTQSEDYSKHGTARSRVALNIPVTQALPTGESYLAQIETPQGVYIGEAAVTNDSGRCFVMAINTCSHEVDIEIPQQQLQPFDVDMSEDFFDSDSETHDEPPVVGRIEHICERLYREHHDSQATQQIRRIVEKYHHLFLLKGDSPPRTHVVKHHINTVDDRPIFPKQYRYPSALHQEVREQVDKLLKDNFIQPSESPYNSPIWIVPKKPGPDRKKKYRLVIDYRKLNEKTIPDAYPVPNIHGGAKFFSVFDLASEFHQVGMEPKNRQKTAFSTPYVHYEYVCMPFGLNNAPPTFQRLMDHVLLQVRLTKNTRIKCFVHTNVYQRQGYVCKSISANF